jgi:proline dehydrogenase
MLAVEFADFGFGTVVGAVVAGSIAILLDQRRRKDEKKRLFLEEKRLMYRNVAQGLELLTAQVLFFGMWNEHFKKAEELDAEELKLLLETGERAKKTLAVTRRRYQEYKTDFALLGSQSAGRAVFEAMETIQQMLACIAADEPCDLTSMEVKLKEQVRNFRYIAREDLGIDP